VSLVQKVNDVNPQQYIQLRSNLYLDQNSQTFPFLAIVLFLRAGLDKYVSHYCSKSTSPEVRKFGEIYQKYQKDGNSKLSQSEV